jgi:hypothetical protein
MARHFGLKAKDFDDSLGDVLKTVWSSLGIVFVFAVVCVLIILVWLASMTLGWAMT